jgi:hypothetical protein
LESKASARPEDLAGSRSRSAFFPVEDHVIFTKHRLRSLFSNAICVIMNSDDRDHHFVPVSYLHSWQTWPGRKPLLKLERLVNNRVITHLCNSEKEQSFIRKGYYNFAGAPDDIRPPDASLLETGMFAAGIERQFARVMNETLRNGTIPKCGPSRQLRLIRFDAVLSFAVLS